MLPQRDRRFVRLVDANRTIVPPDVRVRPLHVGLQHLGGCVPLATLLAGVLVGVDGLVLIQVAFGEEGSWTIRALGVRIGLIAMVHLDVSLQVGRFGVGRLAEFAIEMINPLLGLPDVGLVLVHDLLVIVELMVVLELLVAFAANVGIFSLVLHRHMVPKLKRSTKGRSTLPADMWLFVRVYKHVPFEAGRCRETFVANAARRLLASHVHHSNVNLQLVPVVECFSTDFAFYSGGLFWKVIHVVICAVEFVLVGFQSNRRFEMDWAEIALERSFGLVMTRKMPVVSRQEWEIFGTFFAVVATRGGMHLR